MEHSRRAFLARAAAGGALAWTAPTILSVDAAGAQTCASQSLAWNATVGQNNAVTSPLALGLTTLTITPSTTAPAGASVYHNRITPTTPVTGPGAPQGGQSSYYCLGIGSAGDVTPYVQYPNNTLSRSILSFSNPVSDLAFTVLDIDQGGNRCSGGGFRDRLELSWLPTTTAITFAPQGASPTFAYQGIFGGARRWDATATAAGTSVNGNLVVSFTGPISSLQIDFIALQPPGSGCGANTKTTQIIGISDLSFCI